LPRTCGIPAAHLRGDGKGVRTFFQRADRGKALGMTKPRRADEAGGPGSASRGLAIGFGQPPHAQAQTRSAPTHPLADGPPSLLGRGGQPATDRRGTARSTYQRQPRHTAWRRDLGSAHRTATQPPVDTATTGKTNQRVLRPDTFSDTSFPQVGSSHLQSHPTAWYRAAEEGDCHAD
jgi:hypothetical protein